jgi:hypothetical protein
MAGFLRFRCTEASTRAYFLNFARDGGKQAISCSNRGFDPVQENSCVTYLGEKGAPLFA